MKKIKKNLIIVPIISAVLSLGFLLISNMQNISADTKSYNEFIADFNTGNITAIQMLPNSKMAVNLADGTKYITDNPDSTTLKEQLLLNNINVTEESASPLNKTIPSSILVISIFLIAFISINKGKLGSSSTSELTLEDFSQKKDKDFGFHTVAGNEEAKESLNDIVDFLKNPEKYSAYGAKMPRGVILYGNPGTGKTLLAKAVAGEAGVPFYALSGSDFVQVYVGVGASRVRSLFKKAKSHGKAVIFIDEIDAIGKTRAGGGSTTGGGNDERDQTLNALLTEMSGFAEADGIVVIAATNRLDTLDPALLRPGRFDRHVEVSLPDVKAREKIIQLYLNNKPHDKINIESIAKKTAGFSGAKLESLINEAAIIAAKENISSITNKEINQAYSLVLAGADKKDRDHLKEDDKKITAYHECGHALVSILKIPEEIVSKITIIPTTNGAGGYTLTIPQDTNYQRLDYLQNKIMVLLGGRAAEELIFGKNKISSGAQGDIGQVTNMALAMITEYGMGESIGLLKLSNLGNISASYGQPVVEEAKNLVNKLYAETLSLLSANKYLLDALAEELLVKETINEDEINDFIKNMLK